MKQLSKHNELQHAWIDGAEIQIRNQSFGSADVGPEWKDINENHIWQEYNQYRIKPAEPEKVYPVTSMTREEIANVYHKHVGSVSESWVATANAAIRRAIDDGQVFTKGQLEAISVGFAMKEVRMSTEELENQRAQRDMAIAVIVWNDAVKTCDETGRSPATAENYLTWLKYLVKSIK